MPMVRLVFQPIDLCFTKYYFDILVASSRNIIPHCFPPIDSTGFLPERSTKALPCFLSDRHSVVVFTGALNPFAVEHPTHGSSFTPASSLTPCCLADSLNRRGGGVDSGAMVLVNIHIGGGQKPGGNYSAGMFYVITISSATV